MIVRRLTEDEAINSFCCGDADLDDFIINESMLYCKSLLSANYIMEEYDNTVAFFSLLNDKISIHEFDNKTNFNRFRSHKFVNKKELKLSSCKDRKVRNREQVSRQWNWINVIGFYQRLFYNQ